MPHVILNHEIEQDNEEKDDAIRGVHYPAVVIEDSIRHCSTKGLFCEYKDQRRQKLHRIQDKESLVY
jgi:hypothetical protein